MRCGLAAWFGWPQANEDRATNQVGAHQAVVLYAEATLVPGSAAPDVAAFDWRNHAGRGSSVGSVEEESGEFHQRSLRGQVDA